MKAKLFICVLFLLYSVQAAGQLQSANLSPEVATIVKAIAEYNKHEGPLIGKGAYKSDQWKRYQKLLGTASIEELRKLTSDSNGVVRCYAFDGLLITHDTTVFSIAISHLHDTARISDLEGCIGGNWKVSEYMLVQTHRLGHNAKLDSAILCDEKIELTVKDFIMTDLKPQLKYYQEIRRFALTGDDEIALVALARYKNSNDTGILKTYLNKPNVGNYTIYAVREFPNAEFYPELVRFFKREWPKGDYDNWKWRVLYQALAQYPTQQTLLLFKKTLPAKYEYDNKALAIDRLIALTRYPNPLFENVKNSIKLDEYAMNQVNENMNSEK
jgi:hypothetical protein